MTKDMKCFKNKKILVLGLAKSGEAAARLLNKLGAIVTVNDHKSFDQNSVVESLLEEGIKVICDSHPVELLDEEFEVLVKNPGISYNNPMIIRALEKKIPVITEVELAYRTLEAPIIGVTGSNGKTTTATMIEQILRTKYQPTILSGNIGFPASQVAQIEVLPSKVIMELSSFQLMGTIHFCPEIAVITNVFPHHLDYHESFEKYVAAKWNIQKNMTSEKFLILNFNQTILRQLAHQTRATIVPFSTMERVDGAYLAGGWLYFHDQKIMKANELGVLGRHNVANALAAIAVSKLCGIDSKTIRQILTCFRGVEHRLQYVGEVNNVKFYNDSKSTNVLATQTALSGFDNAKVILIAGGLNQGNEFYELVPYLRGLKQMIVLGESAESMQKAADCAGVRCLGAKNVREATKLAFEIAQSGDVILLSPANASLDMYSNFEARGNEFIMTVKKMKG